MRSFRLPLFMLMQSGQKRKRLRLGCGKNQAPAFGRYCVFSSRPMGRASPSISTLAKFPHQHREKVSDRKASHLLHSCANRRGEKDKKTAGLSCYRRDNSNWEKGMNLAENTTVITVIRKRHRRCCAQPDAQSNKTLQAH